MENLLKAEPPIQKQLDDWEAQITLLERQLTAQMSSLQNGTDSLTEQGSSVAIQVAQVEDQLAKCHVVSLSVVLYWQNMPKPGAGCCG